MRLDESSKINFILPPGDLINQFIKISSEVPTNELINLKFPFSIWKLWWSLFYITGDVKPIIAFISTFTPYVEDRDKFPPIMNFVELFITNAYQFPIILELIQTMKQENFPWLSIIIKEVEKLINNHGSFSLTMYDNEKQIKFLENSSLTLHHIPKAKIPVELILNPKPFVSEDQIDDIINGASK